MVRREKRTHQCTVSHRFIESNANYGAIPTGDHGHSVDDEMSRRDPKSELGPGDMTSSTKSGEGLGGFKEASQQLPANEKTQGQSEQRFAAFDEIRHENDEN